MERVTFLVERTGERIPCLLNPEQLEVRRSAGIARRRGAGGAIIGNPRTDDPLVATGGGTTEYELNLLFDVDLIGNFAPPAATENATAASVVPSNGGDSGFATAITATEVGPLSDEALPQPVEQEAVPAAVAPEPRSVDVRSLTQPLWALAENGEPLNGAVALQRVRFIWGRSWNVPGVVIAVAERHERFDSQGVPKRSWLTLLLRRIEEQVEAGNSPPSPTSPQFEINSGEFGSDESGDDSIVVPIDDDGQALMPLHMIAAERYGDPRFDRAIAEYNDLDDLLEFDEGRAIRLPPASAMTTGD